MARTFPYPVYVSEHPETGAPAICFTYNEMCIHDAYISDCGRFEAQPSERGLTEAEAQLLADANKLIADAADKALNEGCYDIQTVLGVDDGGFAGIYFSHDGLWKDWVEQAFAQYIAAQINFNGA